MLGAFLLMLVADVSSAPVPAAVPTGEAGRARLDAIVNSPDTPLAGAALGIWIGETPIFVAAAGCASFSDAAPQVCERPLTTTTRFRAASISKMAVGLTVMRLADDGRIDLDADAGDYLGWPLRHPRATDRVITIRQLLDHTSTLRDPEAYWAVAPAPLQSLMADNPDAFAPAGEVREAPYFSYANINYALLGGVIEGATGERFDHVVTATLLEPLGLGARFNWIGADPAERRGGATLYRRVDGAWAAQADGPDILQSDLPHFPAEADLDRRAYLADYAAGENASLFSPQGGLRTTLGDLADLARTAYGRVTGAGVAFWRHDPDTDNGATWDGYFKTYGGGVQVLAADQSPFGKPLIGHGGEAYGLLSGAWAMAPETAGDPPIIIVYAITGTPRPFAAGAYTGFFDLEDPLISLASEIVSIATKPAVDGDDAHDDHDEPRPYDAARDAGADVDATLARARETGRHALLVFGANWCHDSRGLARKFSDPRLAAMLSENYELLYVDVGKRDRNIDVAQRFGVDEIRGTPTVVIVSAEGEVLNLDTAHDWRTADSIPFDETYDYFAVFARSRAPR